MDQGELDRVVALVSTHTNRNVTLDDVVGRVLAHSTIDSTADKVRIDAVLRKSVPPETKQWEETVGIGSKTRAFIVAGDLGKNQLPRICLPLLVRGVRVGYLWVLANGHEDHLEELLASLEEWRATIDRLAERVLVAIGTANGKATQADSELQNVVTALDDHVSEDFSSWFVRHGESRLLVFSIAEYVHDEHLLPSLAYRQAIEDASRSYDTHFVHFTDEQHGVCLLPPASETPTFINRLSQALRLRAISAQAQDFQYGISAPVTSGGACRVAYKQSVIALQASAVDPGLDTHAFEDTGVYQLLSQLSSVNLPRRLHLLRASPDGPERLRLLESIYDFSGSMQQLASNLHMHRTSIYNHLQRIEKLIGVDPLDPLVRLELHTGLKLMRWVERPRFAPPRPPRRDR
ncbi:PucR family transcriptional regulator [Leucobacter sp. HY1910]